MKSKLQALKHFASETFSDAAAAAGQGLSSAQNAVNKASATALAAGQSAQKAVTDAVPAQIALRNVQAMSNALASGASTVASSVGNAVKEVDATRVQLGSKAANLGNEAFTSATHAASQGLASVQSAASKASLAVTTASQQAHQAVVETVSLETAKTALNKAQALSTSAATSAQQVAAGAKQVIGQVSEGLPRFEVDHNKVSEQAENVSMGLSVVSGLASAGALLAAPKGLAVAGVAMGVTSTPLIVTAAPILGAVATAAGVVSGGVYFYSKWQASKVEGTEPPTPQGQGTHSQPDGPPSQATAAATDAQEGGAAKPEPAPQEKPQP